MRIAQRVLLGVFVVLVLGPNLGSCADERGDVEQVDLLLPGLTMPIVSMNGPPWENDPFDNLAVGALHGQNGWVSSAPGAPSAQVVASSGGGKLLVVNPTAGTISMGKDVPDQHTGRQVLDLDVMVNDGVDASMAKIEVRTNPSGDNWEKKFQVYFGASMRINYLRNQALNIVSATAMGHWYHVRCAMDLDQELVDVYVDGELAAQDIPMTPGPVTSLVLAGWVLPGSVTLDNLLGYRVFGDCDGASIDFGYYKVDTVRYGHYLDEVTDHTNIMYIGGDDAGTSDTPPAERKANLAALVARAAEAGLWIMLDIELGGPLTVGDVLLAARPHWYGVKYVIMGDELDLSVEDANAEIAALRQRMRNVGVDDSKPVGVTLTPNTTLGSDIIYANWDFINIEAYTQPCNCRVCGAPTAPEEIQAVGSRVAQMMQRIPAAKFLTVVMQGYDRNGAFTNIPVLAELNRATYYQMVKGDPRVQAIMVFDWGRTGPSSCGGIAYGTRGHPELLTVHQEIWADITCGEAVPSAKPSSVRPQTRRNP